MKRNLKQFFSLTIAAAMIFTNVVGVVKVSATEVTLTDYEIYPVPQKTEYSSGGFDVGSDVNVIYESGIDIYTKNRVQEILTSKNISSVVSENIVSGKTNIMVGVNGSKEAVDKYFDDNVTHDDTFFNKTDSNIVYVKNSIIAVLGNNTDSSFYGVTSLKHVFNQLDNTTIRNFRIDDYADVAYRGFIEGYYGNPWSNEDRAQLMKFGGDYKMNQYIFAPKDDPYHNQKWRELYPEVNLAEIKKLAKVGNETKNRYVYTLHPFMSNAIRFDTDANYNADFGIIKAKFTQLLNADVRQFGILADDAGVPAQGPSSYVRLLNDLTAWLIEQKKTYTDLKTDLVFCPNDYMGNGSSAQLKEVNKAGQNVSIVMTGGKIWGEVSQSFTSAFISNIASTGNTGRAPYLWINWPCSDNSKKHLIMGGNDTFLHPGVDPSTVKGIILNPMQQAEANKSALFANADYAWNIWDNKNQADKNWSDSFKYMDHGNAKETQSSTSLREISKHMINQNMDGRVAVLQESVELASKLNAFKTKYATGASIKDDANDLISEFNKLKQSAEYYKANPGNPRTRDQISYWLNCWSDTMDAAVSYLKAAISIENGDNDTTWLEYSKAQAAFEKSKTYGFNYVDHMEYAEVGVQHIVPFINYMGENLSNKVGSIVDPNKIITSYITNRTDTPTGNLSGILDNNSSTEVVYKTPNEISIGTYVGVSYSSKFDLNNVQFLMGTASNPNDTMLDAKIQYTEDGKTWTDLNSTVYHLVGDIKVENLNLKVMGVRLISTTNKTNTWLGIKDIVINKKAVANINPTLIKTSSWTAWSGSDSNLLDSNESTDVWYKTGSLDTTNVGDYLGVDLGRLANVGKVHFVVGRDGSSDKWLKYKLEYSTDNINWTLYKEYTGKASGKDIIDEDLNGIVARYVRLTNLQQLNKWVIFAEAKVQESTSLPSINNIYTNFDSGIKSIYLNECTKLVSKENITLNKGQYIGIKLDRIKDLTDIKLNISNNTGLKLQTSMNEIEWTDVTNTSVVEDARYVRLIQLGDTATNFNLSDFEVKSKEVSPISFVRGYAPVIDGAVLNAFDGNLSTSVKFNGSPVKGKDIVYDLGQTIKLNNIKYTVLDTELDYIRDAKFQASIDGTNWTDVMEIKRKSESGDVKPIDNGYTHGSMSGGKVPVSHSYIEGANLNQDARYIRILFTETFTPRWVRINEIILNDGDYIPSINNPTFISNPIEERGFEPYRLRDGDLSTAYKPNTNNGTITSGSFTYKLSEKTNVKKINIIQNGNSISNAKVMARVGYLENGEGIWKQLGTLNKSLNEILNVEFENIYEIKIEWNGVAPIIHEIITINNYDLPNRSLLKVKYDELVKVLGESYTVSSFKLLQDSLIASDLTLKNNNSLQKDIDESLATLNKANEGLVNISELRNTINRANEIINGNVSYTAESLNALKAIVANANITLMDPNATVETCNTTISQILASIDALVRNNIIVGKPYSLTASALTNTTVTLGWSTPIEQEGLVGYEIYKDGKLLCEIGNVNVYKVEGLRANTIYGFKIVSKYSDGQKSKPASINIRTSKI